MRKIKIRAELVREAIEELSAAMCAAGVFYNIAVKSCKNPAYKWIVIG